MDEHNIRPINVFQVYVAIKEVTVEFEKVKVNGIPMLLEESQPGALSTPRSKVALLISIRKKGDSRKLRSIKGL